MKNLMLMKSARHDVSMVLLMLARSNSIQIRAEINPSDTLNRMITTSTPMQDLRMFLLVNKALPKGNF